MRGLRECGVVGVAVILAAVAGCGQSSGEADGGKNGDLTAFTGQEIEWEPCPEKQEIRCATLKVPLDYADPDAESLGIALYKLPATGEKRGSLVVNPGGPGEPGLPMVELLAGTPVAERYDIVGFDPRGVGATGQIRCLQGAALDAYNAAPLAPTTDDGRDQRRQAAKKLARACGEKHPRLLPELGTESTARDLEIMRVALGSKRLDFLGASYGTLIGQYYAEQFPSTVGRMYLDSVMDPALSLPEIIVDDAVSKQQTFERFLHTCVRRGSCPLGRDAEEIERRVLRTAQALDAEPVTADSGTSRTVTGSDLRATIAGGIDRPADWPGLTQTLAAALQGDLGVLRGADDQDEHDQAFVAVACTFATPGERSHEALDRALATATRKSALFGPIDMFRPCAHWPVESSKTAHEITVDTPGPVLLANNVVDPETPLKWAEEAAEGLRHATLVTNEGAGHGFLVMGACTRQVMTGYLLEGTVPRAGTVCHDTGLARKGTATGK